MKALVLGCGSIGLRHIDHLRRLGITGIEAVDPDPSAREKTQAACGIAVCPNPEEALGRRPDVVLVCTPAATHVEMAQKALEAGAHVFVEKPLSVGVDGTETLLRRAQADGRLVQVGYNLRFHPAVRTAKTMVQSGVLGKILTAHFEFGLYLAKWWKQKSYRQSYMASAGAGGGLIFDGSHEIDLALFFMGPIERVMAMGGKLSALEISGFDTIKVLLHTCAQGIATLSLDCLQPTYRRGFWLMGEDAALRWDCSQGRVDDSLGALTVCEKGKDRYLPVEVTGEPLDTYLEELKSFLDSARNGWPPQVDVAHGVEVLRVAEGIDHSIRTGSVVSLGGA